MKNLINKLPLLLSLFLLAEPAFALKCIGYVSVNGGPFMCAGYAATHPCERADQQCIPVSPPDRPGPNPNAGVPGAGPSPSGPGEMTCRQTNAQINGQAAIIRQLDADLALVERELAQAEAALSNQLSESALAAAETAAKDSCLAWNGIVFTNDPDLYICVERNNKPPVCKLRKLNAAENRAKTACDTKVAAKNSLKKLRDDFLKAQSLNIAVKKSIESKKEIARRNMIRLRTAKDTLGDCP